MPSLLQNEKDRRFTVSFRSDSVTFDGWYTFSKVVGRAKEESTTNTGIKRGDASAKRIFSLNKLAKKITASFAIIIQTIPLFYDVLVCFLALQFFALNIGWNYSINSLFFIPNTNIAIEQLLHVQKALPTEFVCNSITQNHYSWRLLTTKDFV